MTKGRAGTDPETVFILPDSRQFGDPLQADQDKIVRAPGAHLNEQIRTAGVDSRFRFIFQEGPQFGEILRQEDPVHPAFSFCIARAAASTASTIF